jgi:hypothetical protein
LPYASFAVSETLNAVPAVCGLDALAVNDAALAGLTVTLSAGEELNVPSVTLMLIGPSAL